MALNKGMDMLSFLELYQQYPCLWDRTNPDYKNRQMRDNAESVLMEVTGFDNVRLLRAKVRSIRGTYNNELRKINKSLTTCSGVGDIYKPKLHWFSFADSFLSKNAEEDLQSESYLDLADPDDETEEHGNYNIKPQKRCAENVKTALYETTPTLCKTSEIETGDNGVATQSPRQDKSGTGGPKKVCKQGQQMIKSVLNNKNNTFREGVETLNVSSNADANEFVVFGQSVGIQLTKLPLDIALETQLDIQSLLTRARLSVLKSSCPTLAPTSPSTSLFNTNSIILPTTPEIHYTSPSLSTEHPYPNSSTPTLKCEAYSNENT